MIASISTTLFSQQEGARFREQYQYHIKRTTEQIKVDGAMDESIWQSAQVATNFFYITPVADKQVEERDQTEVQMTYDDRFIYVAVKCYGPEPYLVPSLKRDGDGFFDSETFMVSFDPGNERTTGFAFATNSAGVQFDNQLAGNLGTRSGGSNGGFNTAWNNKWQTETQKYGDYFIIEMAIPFKSLRFGESKIWGVQFNRGVSATNSFHAWTPVPLQFFGPDLGYNASLVWDEVPRKAKSNIALIPYTIASTSKDIEAGTDPTNNFDIGVDAKIALTSSLNLDITVNPDFSQVDVDRQVTNLTTVNLQFPEQRIFFVENSDIFSDFGIPPMRSFFSRKIGLKDDGTAIPISYGARITGNLTKDTRVGLMNLQTKSAFSEPGNNYSALAINHRVFGRSVVKGFFHNRLGHTDGEFDSNDYTRNMGLEFEYNSKDGYDKMAAGVSKSFSDGVTDKNDYYHAIFSFGDDNFRFYANLAGIGKNYSDEMGFIQQLNQYDAVEDKVIKIGYDHLFSNFSYTLYPKSAKINTHRFGLISVGDWEREGNTNFSNRASFSYNLALANTSKVEVSLARVYRKLLFPFTFTENPLAAQGYTWSEYSAEYSSDNRKKLNYSIGGSFGGFYSGKRKSVTAEANYRTQPWGNFGVAFEANELTFDGNIGNTTLLLIGPKFEFSFNRDLFWTTFLQYNTQRDNFNINSRIQWRFQPLSDLFLVYTDNYTIEQWGPKNRTLVLKLNYWLNL